MTLYKRAVSFAAVGSTAFVVAACGGTAHHYSAERFKRCLATQQVDVGLTRDASSSSTAALVSLPTFAEWVYFFRTPEAATAERGKLKASTLPAHRTFFRLFKAQRSNVLIFAPERRDWLSHIEPCLKRSLAQRVALSPPVVIVKSWWIADGECLA
jgi:hypothetical protein